MAKVRAALARVGLPAAVAIFLTALGLFLRVEHALTFDGPARGSDYAVYLEGVRWTIEHKRAFFFDPSVNYQARYQPPLWFAISGVILHFTNSERAIASLAVLGFLVRQLLLYKFCRRSGPLGWSSAAALSLHAVLPLGVMLDGKVNSEGFHSTVYTLAIYLLWRMERRATRGIPYGTALAFGLVTGAALLTKATSAVTMVTAALVLAFHAVRMIRARGLGTTFRRLLAPAMFSGLVFFCVVSWWVVPNLARFGHPFPHPWDLEGPDRHSELMEPRTYRRPLGWTLPFEWKPYLEFPVLRTPENPKPNFWANIVTGTWTDLYNRGFCRMAGPGTDYVWGGERGFMGGRGPDWNVSDRCIALFQKILPIGMCLSLAIVLSTLRVAWLHLRTGSRGSLVLSLSACLGTFFVFLFALTYPFDYMAVLNPRYLLPASTPMLACFGIALAELPKNRASALCHVLSFAGIACVAVFLLVERFAR
jgi:hypothetical protein